MPAATRLAVTGDPDADRLLTSNPLALLIGMLLDQQVPMEWAFRGPHTLEQRLGELDARAIATMSDDEIAAAFTAKPALHRYPGSMARRTGALCRFIVDRYDGDPAAIWKGVRSAETLLERLRELPGFGDEKAKIFIAVLAKRFETTPARWQEIAAPFGDTTPRSVADVDSPEALAAVRDHKRALKARGKGKAD